MKDWNWLLLAAVSAVTAAGVTIFGKLGMSRADPVLATTLRAVIMTGTLFAALALTSLFGIRLGEVRQLTHREWVFLVLAGVCGAVSWLAYFWALKLGTAGQVSGVDRLSIALIFLFGFLFLGERYGWKGWLGLGLLVAGVILIAADKVKQGRE